MKKIIIRVIAVLVLAIAGFMGYMYLTEPEIAAPPPIPSASNEVAPVATSTEAVETTTSDPVESVTETVETTQTDTQAAPETETAALEEEANPDAVTASDQNDQDILVIEVAGQANGTVEILLNSDIAPGHVERIKALAEKGAYDNVVFHRVIDGFMAQTGDVEFGRRGGSIARAGMGSSRMDDLKAEFSDQLFVKGVVGMARSNSPDSANSQFFIMFDDAPFLNGNYTIVGRVISGMDVVEAIKKGDSANNGSVSKPDFMRSVTMKSDDQS
jgi:peptidylprolyl isomerase